jgi:general secretion pathway protein D
LKKADGTYAGRVAMASDSTSQRRAACRPLARAALLGLAAAFATVPALAQVGGTAVLNSTQRITTNFKDADIGQVAEAVSAATGRNFIVDPRVRAQVNLISASPMTPAEFYQAFLSILQVHGFVAVPTGNIIKIVPDANVRTMPGNDLPDYVSSTSVEMVTQVIQVKNTNAAQMVQVLRPLVAQYGQLVPMPGTNTIIISDRANNVARIMRIIARVDQAGDATIEVIPLQNSTAADIVRTLTALTAGQAAAEGGVPTKVVADDRSNSVLVSGERAARLRVTALIAHLDTPLDNGGETQVRYLQYADAEKLAPKLKEQITGISAPTGAAGGAAGGGAAAADRSTTIWPDKTTNALVITAPPKTMRSLMSIIDKLDIRRAQVLVEAIIVDVNTDKSADLGVNWAVFSNEQGSSIPAGGFVSPVGGTSIVDLARAIASPSTATSAPTGATIGIGRLTKGGGLTFGAMIRALRSDANTNVIATPSTTTMDNQEAELKVAQEVPFITGQYTNNTTTTSGTVNPFTTVQRQEVGTILKITPQINGGDAMMLKIDLESSELSGTAGDAGSLITNKRSVKTNVLIEDGGIVVIGGLIRDSKTGGETRVPFLGRIPLIGEAFKTRSTKRTKSNLMVFIRPKILADGVQTSIETNAKYNAIRDAQREQGPRGELIPLLPFDKKPELPPPPAVPQPLDRLPPAPATDGKAR